MKKIIYFILIISLIWGCAKEENEPVYDSSNDTINKTQNSKEVKFEQMQESILQNYATAIKLVNQIDEELSKISGMNIKNEGSTYEQQIVQKIEYLVFQLNTKNQEIAKLEKDIKSLSGKNKELLEKIAVLEEIINEKNKIIDSQNERITKLESEIGIAINERDIALENKKKIEEELNLQISDKNTAFYIIGTEKELKKNNIILMEGEGFLGIGGKWVPNPDVDINLFSKINIFQNTELPFPGNSYVDEVVSSHNKNFLSVIQNEAGNPFLKINNPEGFWKTEKKLIIIVSEK